MEHHDGPRPQSRPEWGTTTGLVAVPPGMEQHDGPPPPYRPKVEAVTPSRPARRAARRYHVLTRPARPRAAARTAAATALALAAAMGPV
ncbi:hypothetical protein AB0N23_24845, partial [Streptomyces sp. NPDC052644]